MHILIVGAFGNYGSLFAHEKLKRLGKDDILELRDLPFYGEYAVDDIIDRCRVRQMTPWSEETEASFFDEIYYFFDLPPQFFDELSDERKGKIVTNIVNLHDMNPQGFHFIYKINDKDSKFLDWLRSEGARGGFRPVGYPYGLGTMIRSDEYFYTMVFSALFTQTILIGNPQKHIFLNDMRGVVENLLNQHENGFDLACSELLLAHIVANAIQDHIAEEIAVNVRMVAGNDEIVQENGAPYIEPINLDKLNKFVNGIHLLIDACESNGYDYTDTKYDYESLCLNALEIEKNMKKEVW